MSKKIVDSGISFPNINGERSSTNFNKKVFINSIKNLKNVEGIKEEVESIEKERKWRKTYAKYMVNHSKFLCSSGKTCIEICENGLNFVHNNIEFCRDNKYVKLKDSMEVFTEKKFHTGIVVGDKKNEFSLKAPLDDKFVENEELLKIIDEMIFAGEMEPDCKNACEGLLKNPSSTDFSSILFIVFGATSEMGPFKVLLSLGATVVGIARKGMKKWENLVKIAKDTNGTLILPLNKTQEECLDDNDLCGNAGCDLITHTPEILTWLKEICQKYVDKKVIVGNYTYCHGLLFTKISIATDFILKELCKIRNDIIATYLGSPGLCYMINDECYKGIKENYSNISFWKKSFVGTTLKKNSIKMTSKEGKTIHLCSGIVSKQGFNYLLAKQIQNWRCLLLNSQKHNVSSIIAPITKSQSVVISFAIKSALKGLRSFKPINVYDPAFTSYVMAYLMISDIIEFDKGIKVFNHPMEMFLRKAWHSGIWKCGFKLDSVMTFSFLLGIFKKSK